MRFRLTKLDTAIPEGFHAEACNQVMVKFEIPEDYVLTKDEVVEIGTDWKGVRVQLKASSIAMNVEDLEFK